MKATDGAPRGRVQDAVVIVTGGANGIGRAYCQTLVEEGGRVAVADRDADGAEALVALLSEGTSGEVALAVETDVTSPESTRRMVEEVLGRFGRVDVLVNNAGSYPHTPFESIDFNEWRRVLAVNLDSVFQCTQAVLGTMREAGGGKIVNVATNLVWVGLDAMAHYVAAKAGVVGLTRALAREFGPWGITVNGIAPGAVVPTDGLSDAGRARVDEIVRYQCVKRELGAEDLTQPLLFLCSSASDFLSGQVLTVDGGLTMH